MSRRKHGFPETTGVETRMGTVSHNQRLKRLEASRGISEREPLFFDLREWAPDCPLTFDSEAEREALYPSLKATALNYLIAAGKIRECDRDRVIFIVEEFVSPSRPEQIEPNKGQAGDE
jgi:hypothetical protein